MVVSRDAGVAGLAGALSITGSDAGLTFLPRLTTVATLGAFSVLITLVGGSSMAPSDEESNLSLKGKEKY